LASHQGHFCAIIHYATKFWDATVIDDITSVKTRSVLEEIIALARQHGVTYTSMPLDKLGDAMARLAGDDMELDDTERLLLALERAGHLSPADANRLHVAYMRQRNP
jgi:hypothetical protein